MDHYHLATRGDSDGLWDWNLASNRIHFAPRWIAMVGCEDHEVGQSPDEWLDRVHPDDRPEVRRELDAHMEEGPGEFTIHHRMLHKNGTYRWMSCHAVVVRDESGRAVRMMGSHADVTADTVADATTGLPNRLLFTDRLARAIDQARRHADFLFAALVLDLDRGEPAREPSGAAGSDPVLIAAARRLETSLRTGDPPAALGRDYVVARLGDDRFGVLLEGLAHVAEARVSAQRLLTTLLAPFPVAGHDVFVQPSVGVAVSVTGYSRADDVLRDADTALHRAKALGRSRCEVFDTAVLDSARTELEMEADLEKALERREFEVFYQPIVSLESNRIAGLEALVRWRHPSRGLILPLEFIPLAEKSGFIVRLGAWIMREACRQLAAWHRSLAIPRDLFVSLNLSSVQFRDPGLFEQIGGAVRDAELDPRCLMVELTEGMVMENPAAAKGLIMQLRVMGVRVGLDDFGTGHSALAYLHQFPADFLKVDRSFVRGLESRQDMADIVRTVNDLADQLGLEVIVEGIEREEQLEVVRSLRCGYVQGFLLARPADHRRTEALLKDGLPVRPRTGPVEEAGGSLAYARGALSLGRPEEAGANRRMLLMALGAAVLLVSAGVATRFVVSQDRPASGSSAPAMAASRAARHATSASDPSPAPGGVGAPVPARTPRDGTRGSVAAPAAAKPAGGARQVSVQADKTSARPDAAVQGPAVESFPVVHLHVIGSCTGQLIVSTAGISFVPDKSKDGFTFPFQTFLYSLSDDSLTIKSDAHTFRFKPAGDPSGEAARARLQVITDSLARQSRAR